MPREPCPCAEGSNTPGGAEHESVKPGTSWEQSAKAHVKEKSDCTETDKENVEAMKTGSSGSGGGCPGRWFCQDFQREHVSTSSPLQSPWQAENCPLPVRTPRTSDGEASWTVPGQPRRRAPQQNPDLGTTLYAPDVFPEEVLSESIAPSIIQGSEVHSNVSKDSE